MFKNNVLIFGGSGSIGLEINKYFINKGWQTTVISRGSSRDEALPNILWDVIGQNGLLNSSQKDALINSGPFHAVCWAQGMNIADNVYTFDHEKHLKVYEANVLYIMLSLSQLLNHGLLAKNANLCVISSIWQNIARQDKLSYCVSKSALRGLVLSLAVDLGRNNHMVNAVLPGVIDTPMARSNLEHSQLTKIIDRTLHQRLPSISNVASAVYDLCKPENNSITGQFLSVDLGFENVTKL